ncbi:MAG: hypothetical protein IJP37_06540 [Clostridia bacterium]|nr:hypothetical protein [Clostridia bacterium]
MKRKISVGQLVSMIGTLILCIGLLCNGFELVSNTVFRLIVLAGIIIQVIAFILILSRKEL